MDAITTAAKAFPITEFRFTRDARKNMSACSFALVGSSKSGKTTFLKHLLKTNFQNDIKCLFTQSLHNDIYTTMRSEFCVAPGYIPEVIKTMYRINRDTTNHYEFCVVLDDLIGAKTDAQMTKLLCLYRNSGMSAIVSGQDLTLLSPTGRANVNYVCLFYQNTDARVEDNVKAFLRSFFPRNLTMNEKIALYKELTKDHCFLFINNLENTIIRCRLKEAQLSD